MSVSATVPRCIHLIAISDHSTSTEHHLLQPYSYEKYEQLLTNRVAHDRDNELILSHDHVINLRKNGKLSDGTFPFHLPLSVRVRPDGTLPQLPPLTKRLDETCTYICMGLVTMRYAYIH